MIIKDDRTLEEQRTLNCLVIGTDEFFSMKSYAVWACSIGDCDTVERWVRRRNDMKRVRVTCEPWHPNNRYCDHCHIYAVRDGHPSLEG